MQEGTLPWRAEEMYGNLRRAFESLGRGNAFAQMDVLLLSSALAHYISDAHVPLHGVSNYNGQLSGRRRPQPVGKHDVRALSHSAHDRAQGRSADRALRATSCSIACSKTPSWSRRSSRPMLDAIGNRDVYDDAYYDAFFSAQRRVMEDRLEKSIAAVAAIIAGAWEAAGKPAVPVTSTSPLERRRRQ